MKTAVATAAPDPGRRSHKSQGYGFEAERREITWTPQRDVEPEPKRATAKMAFAGAHWESLHWPFGTKPKDRPYATHKALIMYRDRKLIALRLSDGSHAWFLRGTDEALLPPGTTL